MPKLYELNEQFERYQEKLMQQQRETGELPDDALEKLEQMQLDVKEKMQNCWYAIKNLEQEVSELEGRKKPFADEAKRYDAMIKSKQNDIEGIKFMVGHVLGGKNISFEEGGFSWRKNGSTKVEVKDLAQVPMEYCQYVKKPDLKEIRSEIEAGLEVPGALLIKRDTLQVK